ncbi:ABC transporter permease subunit [Gordonia malaquae]|jgi:ABC-type transport system involved in multi-copper enzyme maturation permease subunit|uniref:ABC transporter permease n=1 Tax=Gordonia malaquae TaxID=410332 RepID=UPI00301A9429
MNLQAVLTLAGLEVRQRIRSTRWQITAGILFLLVSMFILGSLYLVVGIAGATYRDWSRNLLDITLGIVLFLGVAAAPTLSATSINGDRRDATLALVQATPISSWDIAIGKLIGSWLASLALIGVALPYLLWGIATSRTSLVFGVLAVIVTALIMLGYCAIGLGFSSLTNRPAASAMLTQATVLFLLIGLPIGFGFTYPLVAQDHRVAVTHYDYTSSSVPSNCTLVMKDKEFYHTEYTWWMLAPNPLLIVSDTVAGGISDFHDGSNAGGAGLFSYLLSAARTGPEVADEKCRDHQVYSSGPFDDDEDWSAQNVGRSWYIGLAMTLAIGGFGLWVAARRLRVPAGKLARGVRVA